MSEVKRSRVVRRVASGQGERLVAADFEAGRSWRLSALCAQSDPEAWFPDEERANTAAAAFAKQVCAACPVAGECLSYALRADERWGIWGGLTTRERNELAAGTRGGTERAA